MFPPHLPPPSSSIVRHRQWQSIKAIFAACVLGLAAGITGASITLGWLWPGYGGGNIWFGSYSRAVASRNQLEERTREDLQSRIVAVYKGSVSAENATSFLRQNKVGDGVVISSDGWLAVYFPGFDGKVKNLLALSEDRRTHAIERGLLDRQSGVAYLKIGRGHFRVVSFNEEVEPTEEVYLWSGNGWRFEALGLPVYGAYGNPHLDSAPVLAYNISGDDQGRAVVADENGRVAGLTKGNGLMVPAEYITRMIPSVLGRGTVAYRTLGVEGWFSEEAPIIFKGQRVSGFWVSKVSGSANPLRPGDLILQINGRVAEAGDLWYDNGETKANLRVLREGKEREISSPIFEITK